MEYTMWWLGIGYWLVLFSCAQGCGIGVHLLLLSRTQSYFPSELQRLSLYEQPGAFFPDAFYSCMGLTDAAEEAHWPPFMKVAVDYWHEKYGEGYENYKSKQIEASGSRPKTIAQKILNLVRPITGEQKLYENGINLKAFLYGVLTHQVADASWHSLGVSQGLLRMLADTEFHGHTKDAHDVLDFGGDMIMMRRLINSEADLSWMTDIEWNYPKDDVLEIYRRLGYDVNRNALEYCMLRGQMAVPAEKRIAKAAFISNARKSPTLFSHIEDYYLGGTIELTMSIRHCITKLNSWFENGTPDDAWSLCGVFEGRRPFDGESMADEEHGFNLSTHNRQVAFTTKGHDPVVLTTGMNQALFGSSLSIGEYLDDELSLAISAPFESVEVEKEIGMEQVPKGSVYVMKLSQIYRQLKSNELPVQITEAILDSSLSSRESFEFNDRFGAKLMKISVLGYDVLVTSSPGKSRIDFFVENKNLLQVQWQHASVRYGSRGEKLVGEIMAAGDIDGDGLEDLIIGSPRSDVDGRPQQGIVFVLTGKTLARLFKLSVSEDRQPHVVTIEDVADGVLNFPDQDKKPMGYSLFGSKISIIKSENGKPSLAIGAQGLGKVYVYKFNHKIGLLENVFELQGDDNSQYSDFGGGLVASVGNVLAVGSSTEDVEIEGILCMQCGAVYIYTFKDNEVKRINKVTLSPEDRLSFSRFGHEGTFATNDLLIVSSPHARNERGSVWVIELGMDKQYATSIINEGPHPYSNGFGNSISAHVDNNELLLAVGMPYYGTGETALNGAVAIYQLPII